MKKNIIHESGSRKTAMARTTVKAGKGTVKINHVDLSKWGTKMTQLRISEPIILSDGLADMLDITVNVNGGGISSQSDAIRLSIAKALNKYSNDKLREIYLAYDRNLLIADVRRRESRKPNNRGKARSRRQKSYR